LRVRRAVKGMDSNREPVSGSKDFCQKAFRKKKMCFPEKQMDLFDESLN